MAATKSKKSAAFIPMEKFGKDHWSTFAYLESCAVDNEGRIDLRRMRCDPDRHLGLVINLHMVTTEKYPTRLRAVGEQVRDHDDWDCFEDLEAAGLCTWEGTGVNPIAALTKYGEKVAGALRSFKAKGGNYCDFTPPTKRKKKS